MKIDSYEFFGSPTGEVIIVENGKHRVYEQSDLAFSAFMIERIKNFYSEAYSALSDKYSRSQANRTYYDFLRVRGFIMCNFFEFDNIADIDDRGVFHFEFVPCPMRGECKYCNIICNAKFNTSLSKCELQVMKMYFKGLKSDEIADNLYRSIETIKTQKRNALHKLGLNSLQEFIAYANNNNMFQNECDND